MDYASSRYRIIQKQGGNITNSKVKCLFGMLTVAQFRNFYFYATPTVHYRSHKFATLDPVMSQLNSVQTLAYFLKNHFNIILVYIYIIMCLALCKFFPSGPY
jgi:hypothetical protein